MKKRFFASLAILALVAASAVACGDDNAAGGASLNTLLTQDPQLAAAAPAAGAAAAAGVTPEQVDLTFDDMGGGSTAETVTGGLIAYAIDYSYGGGSFSVDMMLFTTPTGAFYAAGTSGMLDVLGTGTTALDDNPYGVLIDYETVNQADYMGIATDGIYLNNSSGSGITIDTVNMLSEAIEVVGAPCPMGFTGTGFSYDVQHSTLDGVELDVELYMVTSGGTMTTDATLSTDTALDDIPVVSVDTTFDCTPTEG